MAAERTRPLLLQRDFASLLGGQLISIFGDRLNYFALGGLLLAHTRQFADTTQSSILLALLGNVMLAPVLLFAPFAGPWVDRWNLKSVLVWSDLVRALLVLAIPAGYGATHRIGLVFAIVFLLFTCNVFFLPAKSAMTPEIVPPGQLLTANTWLSFAGIVATGLGAACGGWVVDHWGWTTALMIDAGTYGVSVVSLLVVRYRGRARGASPPVTLRGYFREIGEGLAVVRRSPAVGLALIALGAVWAGGGFVQVAGNQHVQRAASIPGMERPALLLAALAVGSALGTLWVNTRGRDAPRPLLLGAGLLLAGVWLAVLAVSRRFAVYAGAAFLIGLCIAPVFVLSETLIQEGCDLQSRGRVFSLRDFAMRLVFQVAIVFAAVLTPAIGTGPTLIVAGVWIALAGALAMAWNRLRPRPAAPGAAA